MKVGLFQDPRTPGIFYAIGEDGHKASFNTMKAKFRLACMFGYEGNVHNLSIMEWLCEKATVLIPQRAELELEDPGIFTGCDKIY